MDTTTLKTFNRLYPMFIDKYELLLPDANTDITVKINSVINYLNTVGKLTNDVVKDWNTVMQWVLNDGLTQTVSDKIDQMFTDGKFDEIISHYSDQIVSDFTTRLDTTNTNITTATQTAQTQIDLINQNQVAKQSDLDNTNSQLAEKSTIDLVNGTYTANNNDYIFTSGFYAKGDAGKGKAYAYQVSALSGSEVWTDSGYGFFISSVGEIKLNANQKAIPQFGKTVIVGALGVNNVNDDVIFQTAINLTDPNGVCRNLEIDKNVKIVGTININRDYSDGNLPKIVIVYGSGEIRKDTSGYLFSTTESHRYGGNFRFTGVKIRSQPGAGMIIYNSAWLINMYFSTCDIFYVDAITVIPLTNVSPNNYIQTLHVTDCSIIGGNGYLIEAPVGYDVSFVHNRLDSRGSAGQGIHIDIFHSVRIMNNLIESIGGRTFYGNYGRQLVISDNYLEWNGTLSGYENMIELYGNDPTATSFTFENNVYMGNSAQQTDPNWYAVKLKAVPLNCKIGGNSCCSANLYQVVDVYTITREFLRQAMKERIETAGTYTLNTLPPTKVIDGGESLVKMIRQPIVDATKLGSIVSDVPANCTLATTSSTDESLAFYLTNPCATAGVKFNKPIHLQAGVQYVMGVQGYAKSGLAQPSTVFQIRDSGNAVVWSYLLDWEKSTNPNINDFYSLPRFSLATKGDYTIQIMLSSSAGPIPANSGFYIGALVVQPGTLAKQANPYQMDSDWNGEHLRIGGYSIWVDSTGKLRIRSGYPSNDTDGTVIGSQA